MHSYNNINKKILVIDDNQELCEVICDSLDAYGHDTQYITDTTTLQDEILKSSDVIFLDLCIPDVDGFELIQELSKKNITSELIFMSGSAMNILRSAELLAQQHGLNVIGSICKPFRIDDVISLVNVKNVNTANAF